MLIDILKTAFADTFAFYLKAQNYHWNVEGPDFPQYHDFLGKLYGEVYGAIDEMAELIRTLDSYTPGTLSRIKELTTLDESEVIPDAKTMLLNLAGDNLKVRMSLALAYHAAETAGELGVANFLQDRIQAHEKHSWMLKAVTK